MLWKRHVFAYPPFSSYLALSTRQQAGAIAVAALGILGAAWWAIARKRVSPEEAERQRRDLLAEGGRISDGSITGIDGVTEDSVTQDDKADGSLDLAASGLRETPRVLLYRYRIAGVTYECAQDVRMLPDRVTHLRIDLPVQVRYDPQNPGNSIVVAEGWSGLQQDGALAAGDRAQLPR